VLAPEALKQPLAGDWTSYSGDYTGQRYSRLTQVTPANVKNLTLAWATRISTDLRGDVATGGEGKGDFPVGQAAMRGTVLEVNGILYATSPDHVCAIDGRDGASCGTSSGSRAVACIGNRGAAIWNNSLLFETPDNTRSIDVRTGKKLARGDCRPRPAVLLDDGTDRGWRPVLVGTGNDLDAPGFLQS
jgi:alcohol dehydrogenase (cytochrome c)